MNKTIPFESFTVALAFMVCFSSCTYIFFDQPQPVDEKNLKEIPVKLQGCWISTEDPCDSIVIDHNSYYYVNHQDYCVALQNDSILAFKVIENKIYFEQRKPYGFPCSIVNDTVYYHEKDEMIFTISDSVLLREAGKCYAVNFRRGNWWEVLIIQKKSNGEITICYPIWSYMKDLQEELGIDIVSETAQIENDLTSSDSVFIKASLRSKDMQKLIPQDSMIYECILYLLSPDSTFESVGGG